MEYLVIVSAIRTEGESGRSRYTFPLQHNFTDGIQANVAGEEFGNIRFPPKDRNGEWSEHCVLVFEHEDVIANGRMAASGQLPAEEPYIPLVENPVQALAKTSDTPPLSIESQAAQNRARIAESLPPGAKPEQIKALVLAWWGSIESRITDVVPGWYKPMLLSFRPTLLLEAFMQDKDVQKECQKVYNHEHDIRIHAKPVIDECCAKALAAQA